MTTTIIYTLVFVLAFPTLADAGCAWVLWEHTWRDRTGWTWWWSSPEKWTPIGAAPRAECEKDSAALQETNHQLRKIRYDMKQTIDFAEHTAWMCFPDTVDPRGAKER